MSTINISDDKNSKISLSSKIENSKRSSLIDKTKSNISKKEDIDKISDASFSFSQPSDIDSLYENLSNKSKDSLNLVYESTLQTAEEDLNKEIDLQFENMAKKEPGFDNNIKLISSNFYKSLVDKITGGKQTTQTLDKTNIGYTKYGSISAAIDDQTIRLKNDLSGVPVMIGDVTNITGNIDLIDKNKNGENNENESLIKDFKISKEESLSGINSKNKLDYKKTMSLEYSKEKESDKKEMISYSSQNKQSTNKRESKSSKNPLIDEQK